MNVVLFGATGMVGQGVLRECLRDSSVRRVVTVGRRRTGQTHPKLHECVQDDIGDLTPLAAELPVIDACLFCLGVSAVGMSEEQYSGVTYDLTMRVAEQLVRANSAMTFIYVSGAGTDGTEQGRAMWARVKGRTENALLRAGFKAAYMFRPGAIIPQHGIRSSTGWYNAAYVVIKPLFPLLRRIRPTMVTTSDQFSRAMISIARDGYPTPIVEMRDIIKF